MERFVGIRGNYHAFGGYIYRLNRAANDTKYYYCLKKDCPATAKERENAPPPIVCEPHNHPADEVDLEEILFRNELKRLVSEDPSRRPRDIFNLASARFPRAAVRVGFPTFRSLIYRERAKGVPPIPPNLQQLGMILQSEQWRMLNLPLNDATQRPLLRAVLGGPEDGWAAAVYVSGRIADIVSDTERLHLDATFKVVPANLQATQLLTIHAEYMGYLFPVVFALMTRKTQACYEGVCSFVRQTIPNWRPKVVLADYEDAMRNASRITWTPEQLIGCWFHYSQAVYRMHMSLHMQELTNSNLEAGWALNMLMALPLLPANKIVFGLAVIQQYVQDHGLANAFQILLRYIDQTWIQSVGVAHFSVFRQSHRTNNALESFYSHLVKVMGTHPSFWHFHHQLRSIELKTFQDLTRAQNNVQHVRPTPRAFQRQDRAIRDAQEKLDLGHYNEAQFLHRMAHCTLGLRQRAFRNRRDMAPAAPDRFPVAPRMPLANPAPLLPLAAVEPAVGEEVDPDDPGMPPIPALHPAPGPVRRARRGRGRGQPQHRRRHQVADVVGTAVAGGAPAVVGAAAAGGAPAVVGAAAAGGAPAVVGAAAAGGAPAVVGAVAAGGAPAVVGAAAAGGAPAVVGAVAAGGAPAVVGAAAAGGAPAVVGAAAAGGAPVAISAPAAGGAPAQEAQMDFEDPFWAGYIDDNLPNGNHPYWHRYRTTPTQYEELLPVQAIVVQAEELAEALNFGPAEEVSVEAGEGQPVCFICMSNKPTRMAIPCGHNIVCRECLPHFINQVGYHRVITPGGQVVDTNFRLPITCPNCRAIVGQVIPTYL